MSSRFLCSIAVRFSIVSSLALGIATVNYALEPSTPLSRLGRQTWTMENGLPQNTVPVLLQSHDGFVWAGTELGLARFDGVTFRIFDHATSSAFPDAEIRCLLDAPRNSAGARDSAGAGLWVGTSDGLVHWKNGVAALLTTRDGLPSNAILGLTQTTGGAVWTWTEAGLARWDGQRFQAASGSGFPTGEVTSIAADAADGLWVGTTRGSALFREGAWSAGPDVKSPGSDSSAMVKSVAGGDVLIAGGSGVYVAHNGAITLAIARLALPLDGVSFLDRLAGGAVAAASKSTLVLAQTGVAGSRIVGRFAVSRELPGSRIEAAYADREGSLWMGTNRGLARISVGTGSAAGASVQRLPPTDALASDSVLSLLEDREGDLWVGTESAGLHILRDARFGILGNSDGLSSDATTAIVPYLGPGIGQAPGHVAGQAGQQTLWIGTREAGLNRVTILGDGSRTVTNLTTANGLLSNVILSLAIAGDGALWVGTPDGLNRVAHGTITSYTSADGLADDFVRSVLAASDGSVWIGTRRGLTHLDHGRFATYTRADGLGSDLVGALARDADGDLWVATLDGLSRIRQGRISNYTTANGLSSNVITALEPMPDGSLWIGTQSDGLNLWDGQRFLAARMGPVPAQTGGRPGKAVLLPNAIHAILRDDRGHLWLATDGGLTRLDLAALASCIPQQSCDLAAAHGVNFTTADGLRSRETSSNSHPTASRSADGMLWFTTPRGVVAVDSLHFSNAPPPPPVALERFAVDDRDLPTTPNARITAGALRFQFDYAGLSFASPQKLRYQYTLEGFDHGWTDAGTRRTAYYTNIPVGNFRFRVRAALGDAGFSASSGAAAAASDAESDVPDEASIRFELLPHYYQTAWFRTLAILAVAVLILLVFRRRVLRVEREFRAVMGERNRIAREIHDTLAQGYVGISLQLEILGELLRHNRTDMAANHLSLTQSMVREGLDDARQSIWALRSQDAGEQTLPIRMQRVVEKAGESALAAHFEVHGAYRALPTEAEQEILRIAQEAIQNVKKHAAASRFVVRLEYGERSLTTTVADDGKGFAAGKADLVEGHYGLTGMNERAALIQGKFEIVSQAGMGTTVRLTVPAPEAQ